MIEYLTCKKCGEEKHVSLMSKNKYMKNGYNNMCKECRRKYLKSYRNNNKKKLSEYFAEYRIKNKETILKKEANYRDNNKERINNNNKRYSLKPNVKKHIVEYKRKYKERARNNLTDIYIKDLISSNTKIQRNNIPQILIDVTREKIRIQRYLKEINNEKCQ